MQKIGIVVNLSRDPQLLNLHTVVTELERAGCTYAVSCCDDASASAYPFCSIEESFADAELVLTLGGDGTLLRAAPYANKYNVPLLGINLGHLGFLAEMEREEIAHLSQLLQKGFTLTERMMIEVQLLRNGQCISEAIALNDAVIRSSGKPAQIVVADKESDLLDFFCDGFILATPTGSTAYSMSAGGPILEPRSDGIVVTPICPHTLGSRSVVFGSAQKELYVRVTNADSIQARLECDGALIDILHDGDLVCVRRHATPLQLVKLHNKSFYKVLNDKISRRLL